MVTVAQWMGDKIVRGLDLLALVSQSCVPHADTVREWWEGSANERKVRSPGYASKAKVVFGPDASAPIHTSTGFEHSCMHI